jgi:hypothetical protein
MYGAVWRGTGVLSPSHPFLHIPSHSTESSHHIPSHFVVTQHNEAHHIAVTAAASNATRVLMRN